MVLEYRAYFPTILHLVTLCQSQNSHYPLGAVTVTHYIILSRLPAAKLNSLFATCSGEEIEPFLQNKGHTTRNYISSRLLHTHTLAHLPEQSSGKVISVNDSGLTLCYPSATTHCAGKLHILMDCIYFSSQECTLSVGLH